ncbi:MAG: AMP-binding protein [Acidimicrobiales bacterium]
MKLRTTYRQPDAARYRQPGGAWDVPTLDALLSSPRDARAPAVVDGEVRIDAAGLEHLVGSVAGGMRARGIRRGAVVTWQLPNWWEALVLFRACWRCGAVAAPIHHQVGAAEVARVLADLEPAMALGTPGLPLADLVDVIGVRNGDPRFDDLVGARPVPPGGGRGSDVGVVLFTSGSTGHPKAVLHTHRGLAYKALSMTRAHGLTSGDVALMPSPLAHVSGLLNAVLVPGTAAMTVVLMEKWDAERGVELAGEHRVSFMIGPPTLFVGMMDVPGYRPRVADLRVVSCGSMGVTPEFIDAARLGLGATVKRTYGSTEAPTVTTSSWQDGLDKARDTDGHSVGDAEIKVVDPATDRVQQPGEPGEVLVRGPELFVGYGERAQTDEAVRRGWFGTGDLGTLDGDGWLTIVGRLKELIIRGGENIASAEVERVLEQHPGVRQAVVVGCPDRRLGERVAAFVIGDPQVDVDECRRWFAGLGVARFKTPEIVVHLEEIPLLGVGKPNRPALKERAASLSVVES